MRPIAKAVGLICILANDYLTLTNIVHCRDHDRYRIIITLKKARGFTMSFALSTELTFIVDRVIIFRGFI